MENTFQNLSDLVFLWDFFLRRGSQKKKGTINEYEETYTGMYLIGKAKGKSHQGYIENTIRRSELYKKSAKKFANGELDEILKQVSKEFNYSDDSGPTILDGNETVFKYIYTACFVHMNAIINEMKKITKNHHIINQASLDRLLYIHNILPGSNSWITFTLGILTTEQNVVLKVSVGDKALYSIGTVETITPPPFINPPIDKRRSGMEQHGFEICMRLNLDFQEQIKIDAKHKKSLTCDLLIFVNGYLLYVEFDGRQHFMHVPYFHKEISDFLDQQIRDAIKDAYFAQENAKDPRIIFLRISYQDNLEDMLMSKIAELQAL